MTHPTPPVSDETLEPCPFCGNADPLLVTHSSDAGNEYSVRCYQGCVEIGEEYREQAIAEWNTRAPSREVLAMREEMARKDERIAELEGPIAVALKHLHRIGGQGWKSTRALNAALKASS